MNVPVAPDGKIRVEPPTTRPGDFIRAVNGRPINSVADLVAAAGSGARVWQVVVRRGGQEATLSFRL